MFFQVLAMCVREILRFVGCAVLLCSALSSAAFAVCVHEAQVMHAGDGHDDERAIVIKMTIALALWCLIWIYVLLRDETTTQPMRRQ